jgi:hypothetical protein
VQTYGGGTERGERSEDASSLPEPHEGQAAEHAPGRDVSSTVGRVPSVVKAPFTA